MAELFAPRRDWDWLRRCAAVVRHGKAPTRDKRSRLVGADDLVRLGEELMARAEREVALPGWRRALLYRDGLLIALVAHRPLRRANVVGARIGVELVRRGELWWLLYDGTVTKTHVPIEVPVPVALMPALERYLAVWRPRLLERPLRRGVEPAGNALWVSVIGSAMGAQALYDLMVKHTRAAFGRGVSPHLVRDIAATTIAIEDPARVRMAGPVLGHRNFATTERHYIQAGTVEAARQHQAIIEDLRRRAPAADDPQERTRNH